MHIIQSIWYMFRYGAVLGTGLGTLAGFFTLLLGGGLPEIFGMITLSLLFGGGFGMTAGAIMGGILGLLYAFATPFLYKRVDFSTYRMTLTMFGGIGAAALATRVPALAELLPAWIYIVIAGLAAGFASYRYATWFQDQQQVLKSKRKAVTADAAVHQQALSDAQHAYDIHEADVLHYQQASEQKQHQSER
ncbi:hypothetical protein G4Y79_00530 [Phototrophicus methaneseepsis]|uniref:Uncharacterized protein n=1 Tax=Phototrophicus methaneseepsis TaxID=2710758 RepID=A0A7S8IDR1_9CHLR|nr:hypothetical protein [Phototrophicus methaneseepsis]QPC82890.1 hypothetical protein G4Y79_00530 [Phototrophicus methaneseepsis]